MGKFKVGDIITHISLGYKAKIKKLYKNGNAELTIFKTIKNQKIWGGSHLPFDIKGTAIKKYFKK